ncbi:hypothetical protein QQ020_36000 [Fulvivirgaceae bacterium BMA12]|uniref:Integral membrane protein n=1 Tax=Agaribacillus aureus TaxID=3051825 RepID=A0ABT8LKW4_9BACT|nr:hypothetical protein [Fulvivirgaceae bacterium BMA12]
MALLLFDFGLVVLIWMVQLIVYPGFGYYDEQRLRSWHKKYTTYITVIVMPLMIGQVVTHLTDIIEAFTLLKLITAIMILVIWLITFLYAVPLHRKIDKGKDIDQTILSLLRINWYRTILWTLVFCLQLVPVS